MSVERQISPWNNHGVYDAKELPAAKNPSVVTFRVNNGIFDCDYATDRLDFAQRAQHYHHFFNVVSTRHKIPNLSFALDVGDEAKESSDFPVFTFQKRVGTKNILLPDVEFITSEFYSLDAWCLPDTRPFLEKQNQAVFAGSTTGGGHITLRSLEEGTVSRIEAARYFRNRESVSFRLCNIVQCDDNVKTALIREGFGCEWQSWEHQLKNKFIISMDGNGAACSRVAVSLASNSVLMKYASDYELFYFNDLQSGVHYLSIVNHEDVLTAIEREEAMPGVHQDVANEGKRFASRYLSQTPLIDYTARLFQAYAEAL